MKPTLKKFIYKISLIGTFALEQERTLSICTRQQRRTQKLNNNIPHVRIT